MEGGPLREPCNIVDLSNNNAGQVRDWHRVHAAAKAVYLKATEGSSFFDPDYAEWRRQAKAAGLFVGAYHFARPGRNPGREGAEREAEHFIATIGRDLGRGDLRPALDLEVENSADAVEWARAFSQHVHGELGRWPLFYSYPAFIEALHAGTPIGGGLWLASFGRDDGKEHPYVAPKPWHHVMLHQFSSRATVAGITGTVDLSRAPHGVYPLLYGQAGT